MRDDFSFDVFLSYSSRDKAIVREIAEQLMRDGLRVWFDEWKVNDDDSVPAKVDEGLEHSRVLILFMSANAFGSDWAILENQTFRFRDPLNKGRDFVLVRLDDAPIKSTLSQIPFIVWSTTDCEHEYALLLKTCLPFSSQIETERQVLMKTERQVLMKRVAAHEVQFEYDNNKISAYAFNDDCSQVAIADSDGAIRLWDVGSGRCVRRLKCHKKRVRFLEWRADQGFMMVGTDDDGVRLLNVATDSIIAEFGKSEISKRQMDCFRLLAGGASVWEICGQLGLDNKTVRDHLQELRKKLNASTRNEIRRMASRFYGTLEPTTFPPLRVSKSWISFLAWSIEQKVALAGPSAWWGEPQFRLCCRIDEIWDIARNGPMPIAWRCAWSDDQHRVIYGNDKGVLRLWDVKEGRCLRILEGHTGAITSVALNYDQRLVLSGSTDCTLRLWDLQTGNCLFTLPGHSTAVVSVAWERNQLRAVSGDRSGCLRVWDFSKVVSRNVDPLIDTPMNESSSQIHYTNAKILLVGDTNAGKTGLTYRLATGKWKASEDSTVGAWATQWRLQDASAAPSEEREIWLWDFGGQADQRIVHQLYMDRTALILLLFNADQDDVLPGLRDWQTALQRCVEDTIPRFLVAGRIDTSFKASRGKLHVFAQENGLAYFETSAKSGEGCDGLRSAMIAAIPWENIEKRTSPRIFKLIKDEILRLRDERLVLLTYKELREVLWRRLPNEPRFDDETLKTVISLLDGPGVVKELSYGTYILLAPEWINSYAQAVIRTLRSVANELGVLPLRSIAEGKLIYQSIGRDGIAVEMKRLPEADERVVLGEMERQLEERGLCLRQGDKLVFPSHCGRDRPALLNHPSVFVSYAVKGYLDNIYATLVVKLADSESFGLRELWRDAADFVTLTGDHHMGLKLTRESSSDGDISVYFGEGVTQQEQVIFANYIHRHLETACEQAVRLRHYVCPKCHTPKGNPHVLMAKLLAKRKTADTECDKCGARFQLWDQLEKKFASDQVRRLVEGLQSGDALRLDSRRKGKLLALEVGSRITSADQKCFEIPSTEDEGIDMEVEFTDDDGKGTGKRLYLQLKSGNSHLKKLKDGSEVFIIKTQRWVKYWLAQKEPVMLVIGTFSDDENGTAFNEKLEFSDVRWMEITQILEYRSEGGTKPVKQIEFEGERLDMTSIRKWREKALRPPFLARRNTPSERAHGDTIQS